MTTNKKYKAKKMSSHIKRNEFFDVATKTLTYVVYDELSRDAVIIDPVLDLDPHAWRISTTSVEQVQGFISEQSLRVRFILDTHAHADHLTGMDALRNAYSAPTAIGAQITQIQVFFATAYNTPAVLTDGSQWDTLLEDGEMLQAGDLPIKAIATPGHTPACMSYLIGDTVFTGDTLFMPDYGTGRCDFPGGSATALYNSVARKLYSLPDSTEVCVGHDYQPNNRSLEFRTTIGESKKKNIQLSASTSETDFVSMREKRDATLSAPRLILPSLQVNINAGRLPEPESNGRSYLKMPLNLLGD